LAIYYGGLTFLNAPTLLLLTDYVEEAGSTIYELPVIRGANGHITGFGTPVSFAVAQYLDSGLDLGPGGVLFAMVYVFELYEFKPGSTAPDLTIDLTTVGYPHDEFGSLQFVPAALPGAGGLKIVDFESAAGITRP
jgi:hypothetical protein